MSFVLSSPGKGSAWILRWYTSLGAMGVKGGFPQPPWKRSSRRLSAVRNLVALSNRLPDPGVHVSGQPVERTDVLGAARGKEGRLAPAKFGQKRLGLLAEEGSHGLDQPGVAPLGHAFEYLGAQHFGGAVLHLGELWRHPGFERKAPQQARTKRVDGLNAQAAGGLDGAGKERARLPQPLGRQRAVKAELAQFGDELVVVEHRPGAESLEQPVLHLGGGGLGVGQAQDMLGQHLVEQQPRHPVGQHAGFARTGVGGEPCGGIRARGFDLLFAGLVAAHSSISRSAASITSHSPKRER